MAYYDLRNEYQYQRLYRFFEDEFENERFRSPDIDFDNTEPTDISVQIWSDSDHVADAASFLIQVDQDLRWAAGSLLTVTRRLRRLRTLGLPWVIAAVMRFPRKSAASVFFDRNVRAHLQRTAKSLGRLRVPSRPLPS